MPAVTLFVMCFAYLVFSWVRVRACAVAHSFIRRVRAAAAAACEHHLAQGACSAACVLSRHGQCFYVLTLAIVAAAYICRELTAGTHYKNRPTAVAVLSLNCSWSVQLRVEQQVPDTQPQPPSCTGTVYDTR